MKTIKLNPEEKTLFRSLEKGKWVSIPDFEGEKKRYEEIARRTLAKTKRVNLRLKSKQIAIDKR